MIFISQNRCLIKSNIICQRNVRSKKYLENTLIHVRSWKNLTVRDALGAQGVAVFLGRLSLKPFPPPDSSTDQTKKNTNSTRQLVLDNNNFSLKNLQIQSHQIRNDFCFKLRQRDSNYFDQPIGTMIFFIDYGFSLSLSTFSSVANNFS